jgi:hypothetical protein
MTNKIIRFNGIVAFYKYYKFRPNEVNRGYEVVVKKLYDVTDLKPLKKFEKISRLELSNNFNKTLILKYLPKFISTMYIGKYFKQKILVPENICHLYLNNCNCRIDLSNLPISLKTISLPIHNDITIKNYINSQITIEVGNFDVSNNFTILTCFKSLTDYIESKRMSDFVLYQISRIWYDLPSSRKTKIKKNPKEKYVGVTI